MAEHRARKRFGQHFLVDRSYIGRIIEAVHPEVDDLVVEIGPGLGAITQPLSESLRHLHTVEIDRDVARELTRRFAPERITVHQTDALDFDFAALGAGLRVVGNLPYNISTPLLFRVAIVSTGLIDCHFMLQREVVERMAAPPGNKTYGRLSVMIQYRFEVEKLFDVPAGAFRPPPNVESAFVRLVPHASLPLDASQERLLSTLVAKAFSQRRKTLRNALREFVSDAELTALGVEPRLRPENLSVETYIKLARFAADRAHSPSPE